MMAAQKSLPPTPALTPAMQHRQNGVTPAMAIQSAMVGNPMMQQGMAVGPGEIPNGAGPFVNGGLHNTSDDSIRSGQSNTGNVMFDPRGSQRSQMMANMGGDGRGRWWPRKGTIVCGEAGSGRLWAGTPSGDGGRRR